MKLSYKARFYIWQFSLITVFILIWIQLFNLQIIKSAGLILEAQKQFYRVPLCLRGDIRDRNGELLVLDVINYDIYNNVKKIENVNSERIKNLALLLNLKQEELIKKLKGQINTKILSEINEDKAKKIKELYFDIVYPTPKVTRAYPHKKMAAHVIGYVNIDQKGQLGVENYYEKLITKVSESNSKLLLFPKGTDIVLTIDSILQEYTEEELNKAMQKSKANKGAIIVLSPKTGEIFAWAVYPTFDPNSFFKEKSIKNWSITDVYEPGSTFKIITISSALENMTISPSSTFFDPSFLKVGNRTIRNHNKNKPQQINLLELFKQSSNVASAQVALTMKPQEFYSTIKKFMIGEKTNVDLTGESDGLLLDYRKWRNIDQATTAFGQGAVSLTPLQLTCAVSAIANHGIWTQPHVLKGIWEPKYQLITESPRQIETRQAISPEVADFVSALLKQSVEENLKTMSYLGGIVPGYEVAGKTGTAQKIRPDGKGYFAGHTVASFIGYLPANDPEILALVVVDDPKTLGGWGNTVCGPVFNNIAKMAVKRIIQNP